MSKILRVNRPSDYGRWVGQCDSHPLVSVIDYDEVSPVRYSLNHYGVYGIFLRDDDEMFDLQYGGGDYSYVRPSLICVAPGQVGGKEDTGEKVNISGWALLFHPDLLHGTQLGRDMRKYSFFDYSVSEALHMSEAEREKVVGIFRSLKEETLRERDACQDDILVGLIGLLLSYCRRFYDRQFATRKTANSGIMARFESLLHEYITEGRCADEGLPTIQYCAERLHMSPNYLGDMVKRVTGETAGNYIRMMMAREARNLLKSGATVAETAYALGFNYPQHFSRFFKRVTGETPTQYRSK